METSDTAMEGLSPNEIIWFLGNFEAELREIPIQGVGVHGVLKCKWWKTGWDVQKGSFK